MSLPEIGAALAALAEYNSYASGDDSPVTDTGEQVRRLLEAEKNIAPGGLRIRRTDIGVTVSPGCFCGLEDWREWLDVLTGETPWLGHDPAEDRACRQAHPAVGRRRRRSNKGSFSASYRDPGA
ncbi:hypothetical protein ACFZBE_37195 [Streptomyces sp. NPDC008061]|uniref:hypothetical protein n=1 Tax=Streptomyces sp. NPDC008061 TaxID=3364805 RepID=UPI0036E04B68